MLSHEYLLSILHYDPKTGNWTWLENRANNKIKKGQQAGWKQHGYNKIKIDNKHYFAHVLAWFYITEKWPEKQIDHKNNNRFDNKWENLRLASNSQNQGNSIKRKDNTSNYKGVWWDKNIKKWRVSIQKDKTRHYIGYFNCPTRAAIAYDKKAIELFGEFAFLNFP